MQFDGPGLVNVIVPTNVPAAPCAEPFMAVTEGHELPDAAVVVVAAAAVVVVVATGAEEVVVLLPLEPDPPDPDPEPAEVPDDVLDPLGPDEQAAPTKPADTTSAQTNGRRISP